MGQTLHYGWQAAMLGLGLHAVAATAQAADDAVTRAMKLYEKRQYQTVIQELPPALASLDAARRSSAQLALGMSYLRTAELYRALHAASVEAQSENLRRLTAARGPNRSRFAALYLGENLVEAGNPAAAIGAFEQFLAQPDLPAATRHIAQAGLGLALRQRQETAKAESAWQAAAGDDKPEVQAALAAAYASAGQRDKATRLAEQIARKTGSPAPRTTSALLRVYARTGQTGKGLELARQANLALPAQTEELGRSKSLTFYHAGMLADLAELCSQAAVTALEAASSDARLKVSADYYLIDAYTELGRHEAALKAVTGFLGQGQVPPLYRERARARHAGLLARQKRTSEAFVIWDELSQRQPPDADIGGEALMTCLRAQADCTRLVPRVTTLAETAEMRRAAGAHHALGHYHLARKDYGRALTHLEAARDKARKNKIEANEPLLLVDLAEAYYHTKKYSENLEIYFEMSKQFPAVRTIQEAMQGIYSVEHKSAGDVKIF